MALEASATLTHVSVRGTKQGDTNDTEVFVASIFPGKINVNEVTGNSPTKCEFEVCASDELRIRAILNDSGLAFTATALHNGHVRFAFSASVTVRGMLGWLKLAFKDTTFSDPRYWLSLECGTNTVPSLYLDDIEGVGADLIIRQHRVAEEGETESAPYSHDTWQVFVASLIESGLFCEDGVQLHMGGDRVSYYLELYPTVEATYFGMEMFAVTIAQMFPPQPPRHMPFRPGRGR